MNRSQLLFDFLRDNRGLPIRSMAVFNFLLEATLAGSLLILLGLIVRRFFRGKLGSRAIYAAWLLVALRLLLPVALPNPIMNELRPSLSTDLGARPVADQIRVRVQDGMRDLSRQLRQQPSPEDREAYGFSSFVSDLSAYTSYGWTGKWVLIGYMGAAGLALAYMAAQNVRFRARLRKDRFGPLSKEDQERYLSLCQRLKVKPVPVYWVDPLPGPCLVGLLRPFIAMPLDTPPNRLPHALMHELCHLKARDGVWGLVRNACCAAHWFNPLVWYAARQARMDCELACDDRVVAALEAESKAEGKAAYAKALVEDAAQKNAPRLTVVATGMTMKGRHMKKRLAAIMQNRQVKRQALVVFGLLALAALALAFATAERYAPGYNMELEKSIYKWLLDDPFQPELPGMEPLAAGDISTEEHAAAFASEFLTAPYIGLYYTPGQLNVIRSGDQWIAAIPTAGVFTELRFTREGRVVYFSACHAWGKPWDVAVNEPGRVRQTAREAAEAYVRAFARDCLLGLEIDAVVIEEDLYNQEGRYLRCQALDATGGRTAGILVQMAPWMCVKQVSLDGFQQAGTISRAAYGTVLTQMRGYLTEAWGLTGYEVGNGVLSAALEEDSQGIPYWAASFTVAKNNIGGSVLQSLRRQYGDRDLYTVERLFTEEGAPMANPGPEGEPQGEPSGRIPSGSDEYTYLVILSRASSSATAMIFVDWISGAEPPGTYPIGRPAFVYPVAVPIVLPAGSRLAGGAPVVGARITLGEPIEVYPRADGELVVRLPDNAVLKPKSVEIAGDHVYGVIAEISENQVVLNIRDEQGYPSGAYSRYTLTPDTLMWHESPYFQEGSGCEAIVGPDGIVLAMCESNG